MGKNEILLLLYLNTVLDQSHCVDPVCSNFSGFLSHLVLCDSRISVPLDLLRLLLWPNM